MTDNIKPEHYRKGEIDLYEAFSQIFPHNEYRAGMQMIAMRYMFRDKIDRVEDLNKAMETLERLKEKEIEHDKKNTRTLEEVLGEITKMGIVGKYFDETYFNRKDLLKQLRKEGYDYFARDEDGDLWVFRVKPEKEDDFWDVKTDYHSVIIENDNFPEIKWTDKEPTMISKLLATYENSGENGK